MSSDLISIARSGANAARLALDIAAQNIANAATEGYVRRSAALSEIAGSALVGSGSDVSLHGVRLSGVVRDVDSYRTAEVRRTGSDLARADAELAALTHAQTVLEQADVAGAVSRFEVGLQAQLADPGNLALQAVTGENIRHVTDMFAVAAGGLAAAAQGITVELSEGIAEFNQLAAALGRINGKLLRSRDGSSDQASLLDSRDNLLQSMSGIAGLHVTIGAHRTAQVRLGDASGPLMVENIAINALALVTDAAGYAQVLVGAEPAVVNGGRLAGNLSGLRTIDELRGQLEERSQEFSVVTRSANSGNFSDLSGLVADVSDLDPVAGLDNMLTGISAAISGRTIARDAFASIAGAARTALDQQSGVSLDEEAANLLQFQQAFQASGRVMQVANDLFDTILGIA